MMIREILKFKDGCSLDLEDFIVLRDSKDNHVYVEDSIDGKTFTWTKFFRFDLPKGRSYKYTENMQGKLE